MTFRSVNQIPGHSRLLDDYGLQSKVRFPRSRSVNTTGQAYEPGVPNMRRRFVLAEQLEPRLVLSVVGSRGAPVGLNDSPSSDQAPDESSDFSTSDSSETPRTDESTSPAGSLTVVADSSSDDETTNQRTTIDSRPTTTTKTSVAQNDTTATDRDISTSDSTGSKTNDINDPVIAIRPTRRLPTADLPTKPRVIVLRRADVADDIDGDVTKEDSASDFGIPRRELEAEPHDLAFVSSLPKDAIDFLRITTHTSGRTLDALEFKAGDAGRAVNVAATVPPTAEMIQPDGWFDVLVASLFTWLHGGESTPSLSGAAHMAQVPFFALAGAFTFAAANRKGMADANKLFRPNTDERFELIGRRWWRDRRRSETGSWSGRSSLRRASGSSVPSQSPVSDSPLAQPDISDAFVMSLMDSVESEAFVMSPLRPDDHSSEEDSHWSPSMKAAIAGAAVGGTFAAGSALSHHRGSIGKRPARPVVRYTGTTVVPQSSLPQAARS